MPIRSPEGTVISRAVDVVELGLSAEVARVLANEGVLDLERSINSAPVHEMLVQLVERVPALELIAEPLEAAEMGPGEDPRPLVTSTSEDHSFGDSTNQ